MRFPCKCGYGLSNAGSPNETEQIMVSDRSREVLEGLVDDEVREHGKIRMWPEHWEQCGVIFWKCPLCARLYQFTQDLDFVTMYEPVHYDPA